eukprot:3386583-Rhodomonas_salina.4
MRRWTSRVRFSLGPEAEEGVWMPHQYGRGSNDGCSGGAWARCVSAFAGMFQHERLTSRAGSMETGKSLSKKSRSDLSDVRGLRVLAGGVRSAGDVPLPEEVSAPHAERHEEASVCEVARILLDAVDGDLLDRVGRELPERLLRCLLDIVWRRRRIRSVGHVAQLPPEREVLVHQVLPCGLCEEMVLCQVQLLALRGVCDYEQWRPLMQNHAQGHDRLQQKRRLLCRRTSDAPGSICESQLDFTASACNLTKVR